MLTAGSLANRLGRGRVFLVGVVVCSQTTSHLLVEIRADRSTGVVDMFAGPDPQRMAVFPTRAVAPRRRTAYSFTMLQALDMPDERFDAQHASLQREFAKIEVVFAQMKSGRCADVAHARATRATRRMLGGARTAVGSRSHARCSLRASVLARVTVAGAAAS